MALRAVALVVSVPLLGIDRRVEVKCRADGFRELYKWLDGADVLVLRADRSEPMVVVPLKFAAEIAAFAERAHAEYERRESAHEKHVADVQEAFDSEFGKLECQNQVLEIERST